MFDQLNARVGHLRIHIFIFHKQLKSTSIKLLLEMAYQFWCCILVLFLWLYLQNIGTHDKAHLVKFALSCENFRTLCHTPWREKYHVLSIFIIFLYNVFETSVFDTHRPQHHIIIHQYGIKGNTLPSNPVYVIN